MATRLRAVGLYLPVALAAAMASGAAHAAGAQSISTDPDANATVKAPLEIIQVLFHNPVDARPFPWLTSGISEAQHKGRETDV